MLPASTLPATPRSTCLLRQAVVVLSMAACDPSSGDGDADSGDDTGGAVACPLNDAWEPNDDPDDPTDMAWDAADTWSAWHEVDDAYLCPGEDDWYRIDLAGLGYSVHYLYVRALVKDAGLCGAACGEPVLAAGPENAMTIEVYRADTHEALIAQTADDGVLALAGSGDDYADGLLLRVHSDTPTAEYPYRLSVSVRNYEGEDECEC
ncbi:hypothetical protein [Nannocystis sp. SCPEA4]|uniref:hypothetical protein n=1 Tax=Nannocystis sp. SCPEA4 TaxID=2996787 RepID=UPI00226D9128|nr:hypothetical protein [Nannocystis sp. SCPEA4]MCY1053518.1 hypothetical protein [Nannocystis sp. SCPEA4]